MALGGPPSTHARSSQPASPVSPGRLPIDVRHGGEGRRRINALSKALHITYRYTVIAPCHPYLGTVRSRGKSHSIGSQRLRGGRADARKGVMVGHALVLWYSPILILLCNCLMRLVSLHCSTQFLECCGLPVWPEGNGGMSNSNGHPRPKSHPFLPASHALGTPTPTSSRLEHVSTYSTFASAWGRAGSKHGDQGGCGSRPPLCMACRSVSLPTMYIGT